MRIQLSDRVEALLEKEKLLVTSNFSFSQNVCKSCLVLMNQNEYLWNKGLSTKPWHPCGLAIFYMETSNFTKQNCILIQIKAVYSSRYKGCPKYKVFVFDSSANKGNSCQHFLLFPQCFQKSSSWRSLKVKIT